jgi:hypothetical protein
MVLAMGVAVNGIKGGAVTHNNQMINDEGVCGEHFLAELPPSSAFHFLSLQGWEVTKLVVDQTMNERTTMNKRTNKQ